MRLALVGLGRMGRAIEAIAGARGHQVVARIGRPEPSGEMLSPDTLAGAEVAIEFTRPEAVVGNVERLIDLGVPVVTGTTGWLEHLPALTARVRARNGALLHASNFSIGVQLYLRAARYLAEQMRGRDAFGAAILETHHAAKRDAPSGTAASLKNTVQSVDPDRPFPITSHRVGHVPGTHTLQYDALYESIELTHQARDRTVFAVGAVAAAEWLAGRRGVFTFEDMLFGE